MIRSSSLSRASRRASSLLASTHPCRRAVALGGRLGRRWLAPLGVEGILCNPQHMGCRAVRVQCRERARIRVDAERVCRLRQLRRPCVEWRATRELAAGALLRSVLPLALLGLCAAPAVPRLDVERGRARVARRHRVGRDVERAARPCREAVQPRRGARARARIFLAARRAVGCGAVSGRRTQRRTPCARAAGPRQRARGGTRTRRRRACSQMWCSECRPFWPRRTRHSPQRGRSP